MLNVYKNYPVLLTLTLLSLLAACAPKSVKVHQDYSISADLTGLELDESEAPSLVYKRPGAPTLSDYDRFIIGPVQVNYNSSNMEKLDPKQIKKMQQYFRDAISKELREAGYEVGTQPKANTLKISLTMSGVKAPKGGGAVNVAVMVAGGAAGLPVPAISVGEVTVEATFREALTNRIDAVVVDRSRGRRMFKAKPWSTWADVEGTFNNWANGIREAIDKAHGR